MGEDEGVVAVAGWTAAATTAAIRMLRRNVVSFARAHGMGGDVDGDVGGAVAEVVSRSLPQPPCGQAGDVTVRAAADGEWLSVQVSGPAVADGGLDRARPLSLACAVADRVEWQPPDAGQGAVALLEIAMAGPAAPEDAADRRPLSCAEDRRRTRRCATARRDRPGAGRRSRRTCRRLRCRPR
jgi:hypothetical protein